MSIGSVVPGDDFDAYVNGRWKQETQLRADEAATGSFKILAEKNMDRIRDILEGSGKNRLIGTLYRKALAELPESIPQPIIDDVNDTATAVKNSTSYWTRSAELMTQHGVPHFLLVNSADDSKNPTQLLPYVGQGSLGLPTPENYINPPADLFSNYLTYITETCGLFGFDVDAQSILDLETVVAHGFLNAEQQSDVIKTYNKLSYDNVTSYIPAFFDALTGINRSQMTDVMVQNPALLQVLKQLSSSVKDSVFRDHLIFLHCRKLSGVASKETRQLLYDFYGKKLGGLKELPPDWKISYGIVESILGDELGKLYVEKYFSSDQKDKADKIIRALVQTLKHSIRSKDVWMSDDATKAEAIAKIEKLKYQIGYPTEWTEIDGLWLCDKHYACTDKNGTMKTREQQQIEHVKVQDLLTSLHEVSEWKWNKTIHEFYTAPRPEQWAMHPQTVNAYYSPGQNEIVFPAGILQLPFFGHDRTEADMGAIGAIIGHELSHAFDTSGRRFNSLGKLQDWWTSEDEEKYLQRVETVRRHYSEQEPIPGVRLNGNYTLAENMADIGGLQLALMATRYFLQQQEPLSIEQLQLFFEAYAVNWRCKQRMELREKLLVMDPHSPCEIRINAALAHIPEWYRAYNVTPENKLYLAPEERLRFWGMDMNDNAWMKEENAEEYNKADKGDENDIVRSGLAFILTFFITAAVVAICIFAVKHGWRKSKRNVTYDWSPSLISQVDA